MATIVMGMASSHSPHLSIQPEVQLELAERSRSSSQLWFQGMTYSFGELLELRRGEHLEKECTAEKVHARFEACQKAIEHLQKTMEKAAPDVCIILGDDQHEAFLDDIMPSIAIYHGSSVDDAPPSGAELEVGGVPFEDVNLRNAPNGRVSHPVDAVFGEYLIQSLVAAEFDVARTNKLPKSRGDEGTIGHAFYYVYRRLMDNRVIPNVPVMVNTYYPPNAPTAMRCFKFGQALRKAVEAWDTDKRIAIIASGGLSHFVIEEDLDRRILDGLKEGDVTKLTEHPDPRFRSGTSEIKNWIALGGAMSGSSLEPRIIDYVPCYRNEAGGGCGMGFAEWL